MPFGCGQCMPCRINKRREWVTRIELEAATHRENLMVTLTYNDESYPIDGNLNPRHLALFLKRLRKRLEPYRFRFFGVGEYGTRSGRAHYHLVLFGLGDSAAPFVVQSWPFGFVQCGPLLAGGANYVAGYVTKKLTRAGARGLGDRHPEFVRMSLGIGKPAVQELARALSDQVGRDYLSREGDVPSSLRIGPKLKPIGRYLRQKLRDELGVVKDPYKPSKRQVEYQAELQALRDAAGSAKAYKETKPFVNRQKAASLVARAKIFEKGKL